MNKAILKSDSASELQYLLHSIEKETSGKAIIHIDEFCKGDPYFKATKIFRELNLLRHPLQNSALIYVATKDRKLAIILDRGLEEKVEQGYIKESCESLATSLKENQMLEGLTQTLNSLKTVWKNHFPVNTAR
jgi:uncharacterized membrane protein